MYVAPEAPHPLDALGRTLYQLFCVIVYEHARIVAGYGVWGMEMYLERLGVFELGGRLGRVCAVAFRK